MISQKTSAAEPPGFGLYLHWPFCAQKCPYCDFNSHVRHGGVDEASFVAAFKRELGFVRDMVGAQPVASIFFGGGTPSLMSEGAIDALLSEVARLWPITSGAEITLEANPNSVEANRFAGYRTAGINRVSIGVQSLRDDELKRLGRLHSAAEARAAVAIAEKTFDRFTFDLIYARPNHTVQAWQTELAEALSMAGGHLSLYQLTIEPDTPFATLHAAGKLIIPDDDAAAALYDVTQEMTAAAGLPAYEISNHASPGQESQHNLIYWRYGSYAGVGPGAHGRVTPADGRAIRLATSTERAPEAWRDRVHGEGHGFLGFEPLTAAECADEMLLMGLRLTEGLNLARLTAVTGRTILPQTVRDLEAQGVLEISADGHTIKAAGAGRFILNELVYRLSSGFVAPARDPAAAAAAAASTA